MPTNEEPIATKISIIHDEATSRDVKSEIDELYPELLRIAKRNNRLILAICSLLYPALCVATFFLWKNVAEMMLASSVCTLFLPLPWTILCWLVIPVYLFHIFRSSYEAFKKKKPRSPENQYPLCVQYLNIAQGKNILDVKIIGDTVTLLVEDPATHIATTKVIANLTVQHRTDISVPTVDMNSGSIYLPISLGEK